MRGKRHPMNLFFFLCEIQPFSIQTYMTHRLPKVLVEIIMEYAQSRKFMASVSNVNGMFIKSWAGYVKDTDLITKFLDRLWLIPDSPTQSEDPLLCAVRSHEGDVMYIDTTKSLYDHAYTRPYIIRALPTVEIHILFGDKRSIERMLSDIK